MMNRLLAIFPNLFQGAARRDDVPIYVELGSYLRRFVPSYDPRQGIALHCARNITIADLLTTLRLPHARSAIVTVNRSLVGLDYKLKEGDRVGIFSSALGG